MVKEAVVYILDASASMANTIFGETDRTRFQVAQEGIQQQMADLMLQTKTNECSLIVLKTKETSHHKYRPDDHIIKSELDSDNEQDHDTDEEEDPDPNQPPFPNMTELPPFGVNRPSVSLLRQVGDIQRSSSNDTTGGDFVDGLILAADALHMRTHKKKYDRSIVLWTDCRGYNVAMDAQQMLQTIDSLREMDCRLYVVGMDFSTKSVDYLMKAEAPTPDGPVSSGYSESNKRIKQEEEEEQDDDAGADSGSETNDEEEESDNDDGDMLIYKTPEDRERLLQSLAEKTGGTIISAHSMQQLLERNQGNKARPMTPMYGVEVHIAPGIVINAKFSSWCRTSDSPKFVTEAVQVQATDDISDEDEMERIAGETQPPEGDPSPVVARFNSLGQEMTEEVKTLKYYVDLTKPDDVLEEDKVTKGFRYGSSILEISVMDEENLSRSRVPLIQERHIQILEYLPTSDVPRHFCQGPTYRIHAETLGERDDVALHALKKALESTKSVAICTFSKQRGSWPSLGALFPWTQSFAELSGPPQREDPPLVFLELPYAGDTKDLPGHVFDDQQDFLDEEEQKDAKEVNEGLQTAKSMIRGLMLTKPANDYEEPRRLFSGSPFAKSWNKAILARALDPSAEVGTSNSNNGLETPRHLRKEAAPALQAFRELYPIKKVLVSEKKKAARKGKKQASNYTDFLSPET